MIPVSPHSTFFQHTGIFVHAACTIQPSIQKYNAHEDFCWFRQQDQWVSKHAENRSAISLIPCYKILTGNEEFALAA